MSQVSAVRDRKLTFADGVANPVAVDYPDDVVTGDLLLAIFAINNSAGDITASGWTSLGNVQAGNSVSGEVFYRTASGGEAGSTFDISQNASGRDLSIIVMSIRGELNPGTPEAATASHGAINLPFDPPSLSPSGGSQRYLWIVAGAMSSEIDVWDSNLEHRILAVETGVSRLAASGERLLTAATYDPASMMLSSDSGWAAWTIAIPIDDPGNDGFPSIETTSQDEWSSSSTSQSMTLPSGITAGDVLIATIGTEGGITVSVDGWTELATDTNTADVRGTMFQRVADGTEGSAADVTLSSSNTGSYYVRRISGANGLNTEAESNNGLGDIPAWPTLTPAAGSDKILWIADSVIDGSRRLTGWPVNYGAEVAFQNTPNGVFGGSGAIEQASASPGNGRIFSTGDNWVTVTVAIYPSGSGPTPPPSGGGNRMGDGRAIRKPPRTPR